MNDEQATLYHLALKGDAEAGWLFVRNLQREGRVTSDYEYPNNHGGERILGRVIGEIGDPGSFGDSFDIQFLDGLTSQCSCDGACCAQAWFEHVGDSVGGVITEIVSAWEQYSYGDVLPDGSKAENEALDVHHVTIRTTAGEIDIEMRCSHNGYYGGWITFSTPQRRGNQ